MTIKVFAGISMRSRDGIRFGTLLRIRSALMGIQTDGRYREGEQVEFQLDLVGFDAVVQGLGEILRAEHRPADLDRYLVRILRMRRPDQALLQEWYEQLAQGHVPTLQGEDQGADQPDRALDSQVQSQLPADLGLPRPPPAEVPPAGRPSTAGPSPDGHGRAAIRDVLLAAAEGAAPEAGGTCPADAPEVTDPTGLKRP